MLSRASAIGLSVQNLRLENCEKKKVNEKHILDMVINPISNNLAP